MKGWLKFLLSLTIALLLMMAFRSLGVTIYAVEGNGLDPEFEAGDRVMVNRWSYGLRTGNGDGLFPYGRLLRQPVKRGDIVAYENPCDSSRRSVLFGRCCGMPGDTVRYNGLVQLVPSLKDCADADYFWIKTLSNNNPLDSRQLGFVSERHIIGRAFLIIYNHEPAAPLWNGYRRDRFMLSK